ncbi:hypothetical protein SAMN04488589_1799 [Methanolobus vulcani]|uniref:DUF3829 domain-containing protein n=1 Tax=Methanolobus vulcani TaxID=38026 RepID=A0A7Z7FCY7_9EURY|nr:hypothetical protein [Methanolobus vulcani]SDF95175.1 hypothetical protein SAMN04488589_1799 [Methanolobus vulcani]
MKMKMLFTCIFLTISLALISGCVEDTGKNETTETTFVVVNETEFSQTMEEANTAYVKALVSTSQKNVNASKSSIAELVNKLSYVSDTYGENPPEMYINDKNWQTEIKRAVLIAEHSQEMLEEGDIEAAHNGLEPMRDLFFSLHERNNILHMGDYLTIFHMTMEEAIDAANVNDTETVSSYIPTLKSEWQNVKDAERPSLADSNYNQSLATVEAAIGVLEESASNENTTQVQEDSENLRLAFSKVFAKYGVVIS